MIWTHPGWPRRAWARIVPDIGAGKAYFTALVMSSVSTMPSGTAVSALTRITHLHVRLKADAACILHQGSQPFAKVFHVDGNVHSLGRLRPAEQVVNASHGVDAILGLLEQDLHGLVRLPQPLNAEESRRDGEAVLGPVIHLDEQHLPFCSKVLQALVREFQLSRSGRYALRQLRCERPKVLFGIASPGDVEVGEKVMSDGALAVSQG